MRNVNIGCGNTKIRGYFGVDRVVGATVDVVADIEGFHLPFVNTCLDQVIASHVLEHIGNLDALMAEMHRVCRSNGSLLAKVPHFSGVYAWADPTHRRAFASTSFDYFSSVDRNNHTSKGWKVIQKKLKYSMNSKKRAYKILNWIAPLVYIIDGVANSNLFLCERLWCFWVGGFEEIEFILVKE